MKVNVLVIAILFLGSILLGTIGALFYESFVDRNLPTKNIGVIRDVSVVPTSFNEAIKIQVKTDNKFIICNSDGGSYPQLTLGDSLKVKYDGTYFKYLVDDNGHTFRIR